MEAKDQAACSAEGGGRATDGSQGHGGLQYNNYIVRMSHLNPHFVRCVFHYSLPEISS